MSLYGLLMLSFFAVSIIERKKGESEDYFSFSEIREKFDLWSNYFVGFVGWRKVNELFNTKTSRRRQIWRQGKILRAAKSSSDRSVFSSFLSATSSIYEDLQDTFFFFFR